MTTVIIVIVVVVVLAALAGAAVAISRKRRSDQLRQEFGPEYDRAVESSGSKAEAEKELAGRRKRHDQLDLRQLDPQTRDRFQSDWKMIQAEFVDDPGGAVDKADSLVTTIMRERGYPVDDFDQRAADVSVEHPQVVENYREARRIRDAHRNGSAGTEDLRGAVTSYRSLVDALLDERGDGRGGHDDRGDDRGGRGDDRGDGRRDDRGGQGPDGPGRHRGNGRDDRGDAGGHPDDQTRDHDGSRR